MANINLYNSYSWEFFASFNRFSVIIYYMTSRNFVTYIGQEHDTQHSQWRNSMANIDLYKNRTLAFFASSHRFPDIIY